MNTAQLKEQRNYRHRDLLPPDAIEATEATIIGVGGIGRQVALTLAAIGVTHFQLIDPDTVEPVNLGPQGYRPDQITKHKVNATAEDIAQINPEADIRAVAGPWNKHLRGGTDVFICVDSIKTRKDIWTEWHSNGYRAFIDGRMGAETMRILTIENRSSSKIIYDDSLFSADEAEQLPCTQKSTYYCANVCAGIMVSQFTQVLRNMRPASDVVFDLFTLTLDAQ